MPGILRVEVEAAIAVEVVRYVVVAEPEHPTPDQLSPLRVLFRGATMGCGVCGRRRGLFERWVVMAERCPRCNLRFERSEGHFVGAVGINTLITFALLLVGLIAFFVVTYPDIPAGAWVFAAVPVLALVPVLTYPMSKTLWTAIDLIMRPLEKGEAAPPRRG